MSVIQATDIGRASAPNLDGASSTNQQLEKT
jgi:hypothetical protein